MFKRFGTPDTVGPPRISIYDFLDPFVKKLEKKAGFPGLKKLVFNFTDKTRIDKLNYTYLLKSKFAKDLHYYQEYLQEIETLVLNYQDDFNRFMERNMGRFKYISDYQYEVFEAENKIDGLPKLIIGIQIETFNKEYGDHWRWLRTFTFSEWKNLLHEVEMEGYDSEYYFAKARHKKVKPYKSNTLDNSFAKRQRSLVTPKLRYDILRRDGFKCVCCGRSVKEGAVLEVDHIKPVSQGGKTVPNNLQTLCRECNRGKSNR